LAKILVHPSGGIEKEYEVIADAPLPDAFFSDFRRGTSIDGVVYRAREARRTGSASARIVLIEGKNREIRRFLEHYGLRARLLKRIRIGSVSIENLAEGSFRELTEAEVASLKSNVPFHGGRSR
jgi:pseudouridine synthase